MNESIDISATVIGCLIITTTTGCRDVGMYEKLYFMSSSVTQIMASIRMISIYIVQSNLPTDKRLHRSEPDK